jgi:hypothetical protein
MRLFVWCVRCDYLGAMEVGSLIDMLGGVFPIPQVAQKLVCTQCGAREFNVNPYWNDIDIPGAPKVFPVAPA